MKNWSCQRDRDSRQLRVWLYTWTRDSLGFGFHFFLQVETVKGRGDAASEPPLPPSSSAPRARRMLVRGSSACGLGRWHFYRGSREQGNPPRSPSITPTSLFRRMLRIGHLSGIGKSASHAAVHSTSLLSRDHLPPTFSDQQLPVIVGSHFPKPTTS